MKEVEIGETHSMCWEMRYAYRVRIRTSKEKKPLWWINIKVNFTEKHEIMDRLYL